MTISDERLHVRAAGNDETADMARELLARRAQVRAKDEATADLLDMVDGFDSEMLEALRQIRADAQTIRTSPHGVVMLATHITVMVDALKRLIAERHAATRTPDAGRAEPKTDKMKGHICDGVPCFVCADDALRALRSEGAPPREPAEPDEAARVASEWLEKQYGVPVDDREPEDVPSLAALLRTRDAAAREAGRVEGLEEAAKVADERAARLEAGHFGPADPCVPVVRGLAKAIRALAARRPGGGAKP